jgi:serine/threonine protein kinase
MPTFPSVGNEIGGYRVDDLIGRGGMSVVYLAEQLALGRKVALKLLSPELSEDEAFRQRFVRESRLAANLEHPNIIPVYEAGEVDGLLFIAMRYVEGSDLKALLIREGKLPLARMIEIVSQAALALDAAHARGLVHRDVKPGNILVASGEGPEASEHVYLSDFGLTKRTDSKSRLTSTGQFVGTLDYVAPEQIQGKEVSSRTDLYSLACVAYECLTGSPPFERDSEVAVMYAHLQEPPPDVNALRSDLPSAVGDAMKRALAKDPEERFESCRAFMRALKDAAGQPISGERPIPTLDETAPHPQADPPITVPPTPEPTADAAATGPMAREGAITAPRKQRTGMPMWMPIAALVVVAGAAGAFLLTRGGTEPNDDPGPNNNGTTSSPTTTPTDKPIVFEPGTLLIKRRDGSGESLVTATWNAEMTRIVEDPLCDLSGKAGRPDWHPDRTKAVISINKEIYVVDMASDNPCDLSSLEPLTDNDVEDGPPVWSPDGRMIAFASNRANPGAAANDIWVMRANGTGQRRVTTSAADEDTPAWSPTGTRIAYESNAEGDFEIFTIGVDGSDSVNVTDNEGGDFWPHWTPGDLITYRSSAGGSGFDIWTIGDGGSPAAVQVETQATDDHQPAWLDDTHIVFVGDDDLFVVDLDSGEVSRLTDTPGAAEVFAIAPRD